MLKITQNWHDKLLRSHPRNTSMKRCRAMKMSRRLKSGKFSHLSTKTAKSALSISNSTWLQSSSTFMVLNRLLSVNTRTCWLKSSCQPNSTISTNKSKTYSCSNCVLESQLSKRATSSSRMSRIAKEPTIWSISSQSLTKTQFSTHQISTASTSPRATGLSTTIRVRSASQHFWNLFSTITPANLLKSKQCARSNGTTTSDTST